MKYRVVSPVTILATLLCSLVRAGGGPGTSPDAALGRNDPAETLNQPLNQPQINGPVVQENLDTPDNGAPAPQPPTNNGESPPPAAVSPSLNGGSPGPGVPPDAVAEEPLFPLAMLPGNHSNTSNTSNIDSFQILGSNSSSYDVPDDVQPMSSMHDKYGNPIPIPIPIPIVVKGEDEETEAPDEPEETSEQDPAAQALQSISNHGLISMADITSIITGPVSMNPQNMEITLQFVESHPVLCFVITEMLIHHSGQLRSWAMNCFFSPDQDKRPMAFWAALEKALKEQLQLPEKLINKQYIVGLMQQHQRQLIQQRESRRVASAGEVSTADPTPGIVLPPSPNWHRVKDLSKVILFLLGSDYYNWFDTNPDQSLPLFVDHPELFHLITSQYMRNQEAVERLVFQQTMTTVMVDFMGRSAAARALLQNHQKFLAFLLFLTANYQGAIPVTASGQGSTDHPNLATALKPWFSEQSRDTPYSAALIDILLTLLSTDSQEVTEFTGGKAGALLTALDTLVGADNPYPRVQLLRLLNSPHPRSMANTVIFQLNRNQGHHFLNTLLDSLQCIHAATPVNSFLAALLGLNALPSLVDAGLFIPPPTPAQEKVVRMVALREGYRLSGGAGDPDYDPGGSTSGTTTAPDLPVVNLPKISDSKVTWALLDLLNKHNPELYQLIQDASVEPSDQLTKGLLKFMQNFGRGTVLSLH